MTYAYQCVNVKCKHHFDVIKSVKDIDVNENCPQCDEFAERLFVPQHVHFLNTKVEHPEYNPGLGCVVRNKEHRKQICKERGLVEIGNESADSWAKRSDRILEERQERVYDEAFAEARAMADSPGSIPSFPLLGPRPSEARDG